MGRRGSRLIEDRVEHGPEVCVPGDDSDFHGALTRGACPSISQNGEQIWSIRDGILPEVVNFCGLEWQRP